jgi:hypothetical protein
LKGEKTESASEKASIALPTPWARFMKITRKPLPVSRDGKCRHRVWFEVLELTERFDAARGDDQERTCARLLPSCKADCEAKACTMTDASVTEDLPEGMQRRLPREKPTTASTHSETRPIDAGP